MTDREIAVIEGLSAQYDRAIGPGGEKAWLAGQLAAKVPVLLAEVERLSGESDRYRIDMGEADAEVEELRAELARVRTQVAADLLAVIHAEREGDWTTSFKQGLFRAAWIADGFRGAPSGTVGTPTNPKEQDHE